MWRLIPIVLLITCISGCASSPKVAARPQKQAPQPAMVAQEAHIEEAPKVSTTCLPSGKVVFFGSSLMVEVQCLRGSAKSIDTWVEKRAVLPEDDGTFRVPVFPDTFLAMLDGKLNLLFHQQGQPVRYECQEVAGELLTYSFEPMLDTLIDES